MAYKASHTTRRGPTVPAGAGIEETFRSARFLPLDLRRALAIRVDRNVHKTKKTRGLALLPCERVPNGRDKTVKT